MRKTFAASASPNQVPTTKRNDIQMISQSQRDRKTKTVICTNSRRSSSESAGSNIEHRDRISSVASPTSDDHFRGDDRSSEVSRLDVNGIPFDNLTMTTAIAKIRAALSGASFKRIAFLNADCSNLASRNADYRQALRSADLVCADGVGIRIAGRILGFKVKDNVNGTDLFPLLCRELEESDTRVFLLGGQPGVPEKVKAWVKDHSPGLNVCGLQHGFFEASDDTRVLRQIDDSRADLVLVALGAPKQDLWIRDILSRSNARVGIGVGGLFDFFSGRIPRAPLWMRKSGLEWVFRLYQEPRRLWQRYIIGNFTFLVRTVLYRLKGKFIVERKGLLPRVEVRNA